MTSVWPLYGPVAGGTRVTITGKYLSTVTDVYFAQHQGVIDKQRSAVLLRSLLLHHMWPLVRKQLTIINFETHIINYTKPLPFVTFALLSLTRVGLAVF